MRAQWSRAGLCAEQECPGSVGFPSELGSQLRANAGWGLGSRCWGGMLWALKALGVLFLVSDGIQILDGTEVYEDWKSSLLVFMLILGSAAPCATKMAKRALREELWLTLPYSAGLEHHFLWQAYPREYAALIQTVASVFLTIIIIKNCIKAINFYWSMSGLRKLGRNSWILTDKQGAAFGYPE